MAGKSSKTSKSGKSGKSEQPHKKTRKQQEKPDVIEMIAENYINLEKSTVRQLNVSSQHHLTSGSLREEIWKSLFESIVPRKFTVEQSVFIMDSAGGISNEVDLAIIDEQYTPYIFRFGQMKFVPVEAVAVAIECKSTSLSKGKLEKWTKSLDKLKTSSDAFVRLASYFHTEASASERPSTQTSTRPIKILCHLDQGATGKNMYGFDLHLFVAGDRLKTIFALKSSVSGQKETDNRLENWYVQLNHHKTPTNIPKAVFPGENRNIADYAVRDWEQNGAEEITLLSLTFQLNQLLMLINNPMFFPHMAYANRFDAVLKAVKSTAADGNADADAEADADADAGTNASTAIDADASADASTDADGTAEPDASAAADASASAATAAVADPDA